MLKRLIAIATLTLALSACKTTTPDTTNGTADSEPAVGLASPIPPASEAPLVPEEAEPAPEQDPAEPEPAPEPIAEEPALAEPEFSEAIRADYRPRELSSLSESDILGDSPVAMATQAFAAEILEEGRYSEGIESEIGQARAVVIFTQNNLADTSVKDMRYRAEYVKLTEQWQLVWVGTQSRCWEGRGHQDWSKALCS